MNTEIVSLRALTEEAKVTVALAEKFYEHLQADPRRSSTPPEARSSDPLEPRGSEDSTNPPSVH